ncbi:MAG: hypothetical protein KDK76_04950 [Chlamydiia bacterium]|nr:hypothetical protein [Chlamydiia bacterium]
MSGASGVQGGGEPHQYSKEELEKYQQDYEKGLHLFKESFKDYNKEDAPFHKKEQLKKVMMESLQVMNETAKVALTKEKQQDELKLNADFEAFLNDTTPENQKKVANDLEALSSD